MIEPDRQAMQVALVGLEPGSWVRHPGCPDWGVGQVQSVAGHLVTANFEHVGKISVNARVVTLQVLDGPPDP